MFGLPEITPLGTPPTAGEVVGGDPWDDADDATYARGSARDVSGSGSGFHHITASIAPTALTASEAPAMIRVSATISEGATGARFVANLYAPGASSPTLNFSDGLDPVYVTVPLVDGLPQDVAVTLYDWNAETPATPAQIVDFFAAGGSLRIQPSPTGTTPRTCVVTIHRIGAAEVVPPITFRRTFPRDDGLAGGARRTFPPSRALQSGNRTSGGYL